MVHHSSLRFRLLTFAALLVFALSISGVQAVTLVHPQTANHVHFSICPALDGINILVPDPAEGGGGTFLLTSPSQEIQDELAGGDSTYGDWTFDYAGSTLNGTFTVDIYKSRFKGTHHSGSEISMRYKKGAGDPANLRWVQLVTTSDPLDPNGSDPPGPPTSPYIDPYPDDSDGVGGPFYYSDEVGHTFDYRTRIGGATDASGFGKDYDIRFYDFPSRIHAPTSYVKWQGELWLTAADTTDKEVTFHDGVGYGFEAGCIDWDDLEGLTFGATSGLIVSYDVTTAQLSFTGGLIDVMNPFGDPFGFDPIFLDDPLNGAQMQILPFEHMPEANLPMGLELFRGGAIQVFDPEFGDLLFQAEIPFLILGDQMHDLYNMTGVYDQLLMDPGGPSFFLQQYEQFRQDGLNGGSGGTGGTDRTSQYGKTEPEGIDPYSTPGHTPQIYMTSAVPISTLLSSGGSAPVMVWNSFGRRDPGSGLVLHLDATSILWGGTGKLVLYDVVQGDLDILNASGGDFTLSMEPCLADNVPALPTPHTGTPPGQNLWFLVRGVRPGLNGTYDTLQPSQVGLRDSEIAAAPGACP